MLGPVWTYEKIWTCKEMFGRAKKIKKKWTYEEKQIGRTKTILDVRNFGHTKKQILTTYKFQNFFRMSNVFSYVQIFVRTKTFVRTSKNFLVKCSAPSGLFLAGGLPSPKPPLEEKRRRSDRLRRGRRRRSGRTREALPNSPNDIMTSCARAFLFPPLVPC